MKNLVKSKKYIEELEATVTRLQMEIGIKSKEVYFTENQIQQLQSKVHKITGDGEVMMLFNELLGVNAG